jgi:SAM-dependent methyltransferase
MSTPSFLREAEHKALSSLSLDGEVLDLGGEKGSEYLSCINGNFKVVTLNADEKAKPDIFHNIEKLLPVENESYDHVLLVNVLEHIFNYKQLLAESLRVVRPGGKVVVIVPFLFPIHPSPADYFRFTGETLKKEFETVGAENIQVRVLAGGVFGVAYLFFDRLLPTPVRIFNFYTFRFVVIFCDIVWQSLARALGKKYKREEYPLGFMAVAQKKK